MEERGVEGGGEGMKYGGRGGRREGLREAGEAGTGGREERGRERRQ